jgi:hypothetical protein
MSENIINNRIDQLCIISEKQGEIGRLFKVFDGNLKELSSVLSPGDCEKILEMEECLNTIYFNSFNVAYRSGLDDVQTWQRFQSTS